MHLEDTALPIEFGPVGAVDAKQSVLFVLKQVERARSERVLHAAVHVRRQLWTTIQHFRGWRPSGPERLSTDFGHALP